VLPTIAAVRGYEPDLSIARARSKNDPSREQGRVTPTQAVSNGRPLSSRSTPRGALVSPANANTRRAMRDVRDRDPIERDPHVRFKVRKARPRGKGSLAPVQ